MHGFWTPHHMLAYSTELRLMSSTLSYKQNDKTTCTSAAIYGTRTGSRNHCTPSINTSSYHSSTVIYKLKQWSLSNPDTPFRTESLLASHPDFSWANRVHFRGYTVHVYITHIYCVAIVMVYSKNLERRWGEPMGRGILNRLHGHLYQCECASMRDCVLVALGKEGSLWLVNWDLRYLLLNLSWSISRAWVYILNCVLPGKVLFWIGIVTEDGVNT